MFGKLEIADEQSIYLHSNNNNIETPCEQSKLCIMEFNMESLQYQ